ncbi:MAG: Na(+)-translocating NADH-quinone reductase subunit C [Ectothiorhodospiraceae bacterium]|nr:Na(+)-translocating NADH-quinone reductase subunit C [Ectothiorhodospiraceae bacterium]MCH8506341.1 Na(+)-translocating NADH-quinone reductase subunit C [Ectothiorhodospiraceae bacterium]
MAAGRESIGNTLRVAFVVCLACAVVVSTASVALRPAQLDNRTQYRQINILQAADLYQPGMDVRAAFAQIDRRFVDIDTGEYVEQPADYDPVRAARNPETSRPVAPDPASIRRQADVAEVYLAYDDDGNVRRIILPVHGYGLWSTMYGFLALEPDANTVAGIGFFEHGETPGLGGEIDNPRWQSNWQGKQLFDDDGEVAIRVLKGAVGEGTPGREHLVDGLSGATLTANGVNNLVRFWVGEAGFGPYLQRMRQAYQDNGDGAI